MLLSLLDDLMRPLFLHQVVLAVLRVDSRFDVLRLERNLPFDANLARGI